MSRQERASFVFFLERQRFSFSSRPLWLRARIFQVRCAPPRQEHAVISTRRANRWGKKRHFPKNLSSSSSPPEILDRVKGVDRSQRLAPRRRGHLARAGPAGLLVVEPERPLVLERVGGRGVVGHAVFERRDFSFLSFFFFDVEAVIFFFLRPEHSFFFAASLEERVKGKKKTSH